MPALWETVEVRTFVTGVNQQSRGVSWRIPCVPHARNVSLTLRLRGPQQADGDRRRAQTELIAKDAIVIHACMTESKRHGSPEIEDAAREEVEIPADETNEG